MSDIVAFQPVRALDRNGEPVPGALARFFLSGTTTPVTVFSDPAEAVPHATPLEADANGVFPAVFRAGVTLKVEVTDPDGLVLPGFPVDPAATVRLSGGAAASTSFAPTGNIPATNVQDAIETVQGNFSAPLLAGGIGVTGDGPVLANIDATNTASGFYRWTDTSTGTFPTGWSGNSGVIYLLRENAGNASQVILRRDVQAAWRRRLVNSVWQDWVRDDRAPELSQAQVVDPASAVFGLVSGQRVSQAIAAQAGAWTFTGTAVLAGNNTHTITGIPTAAREIEIELANIGGFTSQTTVNIQIGNGTITASGYNAHSSALSASVGTFHSNTHFPFYVVNTWQPMNGLMRLRRAQSNSWYSEHFASGASTGGVTGGGRSSVDTGIDRVRITNTPGITTWTGTVRVRAR